MLSKTDHEKIAAAVGEAEEGTSGEILCVLARSVSNYRETALAWGAGAALLAPPIGLALGIHTLWPIKAASAWSAASTGDMDAAVRLALSSYAMAQIVVFAVVAIAIAAWRPLKLALTPKILKHRRVHQAAMAQLMATRMLGSSIGAAVVIFASIEDRMVVVVADEAIHARVGDPAWDQAVAAVLNGIKRGDPASGFVDAVRLCGALLAEHFPADAQTRHGLADGLVEI